MARTPSPASGVLSELRGGLIPLRILQILEGGPTYGYDLLAQLAREAERLGSVGPSNLYPTLARLGRRGLVRSYYGTTSRGPIRKYYELTASGRIALREAIALIGSRSGSESGPGRADRPRPARVGTAGARLGA